MKKIFILLLSFGSLLWSGSLSSAEIINMIGKIKEEREGINITTLENTPNPFLIVKPKVPEVIDDVIKEVMLAVPQHEYLLSAIFNKAAFIDGKWYKVGSKLNEYRIGYIGKNSVNLLSENAKKTLTMKKKKNFINLKQGKK